MKIAHITILCAALTTPIILADPADKNTQPTLTQKEIAEGLAKHTTGAKKLSTEQDELSADVQDLIDEQTDLEIIGLLRQIEKTMADATDRLEQSKTDGTTIATETEVIEKIFEAAKKKQQKSGKGKGKGKSKGQSSMLEMMKRMMEGGRDIGKGQQPGQKPGGKPGDKPGQGGNGDGASSGKTGAPDNTAENTERRVPKNSGTSGSTLPREFQKAMDAYNKGAAKKSTQP